MTLNPRTTAQLISLDSSLASITNQVIIKHGEKEAQQPADDYQQFQVKLHEHRELVTAAFDHVFGERRYALDSLFSRLDQTIAHQDYQALERLVLGIIAVLEQNSLHDFNNFQKALQSPEFVIEL